MSQIQLIREASSAINAALKLTLPLRNEVFDLLNVSKKLDKFIAELDADKSEHQTRSAEINPPITVLTLNQIAFLSHHPMDIRIDLGKHFANGSKVLIVPNTEVPEAGPWALCFADDQSCWVDCFETQELALECAEHLGLVSESIQTNNNQPRERA